MMKELNLCTILLMLSIAAVNTLVESGYRSICFLTLAESVLALEKLNNGLEEPRQQPFPSSYRTKSLDNPPGLLIHVRLG